MTQVKKASPLGRKLDSQYETMEKSREIRTVWWSAVLTMHWGYVSRTEEWEADEKVRHHERSCPV